MLPGAMRRRNVSYSYLVQRVSMGGAEGQASDMEITVNEIKKLKKELYEIIEGKESNDPNEHMNGVIKDGHRVDPAFKRQEPKFKK